MHLRSNREVVKKDKSADVVAIFIKIEPRSCKRVTVPPNGTSSVTYVLNATRVFNLWCAIPNDEIATWSFVYPLHATVTNRVYDPQVDVDGHTAATNRLFLVDIAVEEPNGNAFEKALGQDAVRSLKTNSCLLDFVSIHTKNKIFKTIHVT